MTETAAWLALAFRSTMQTADILKTALGPGPDPDSFPQEVLLREVADVGVLDTLGVRVVPIRDPVYPERLRMWISAPVVLCVAGRSDLLNEEGVRYLAYRTKAAPELSELVDSGSRVVVVLSKGMLKAKPLMRALREPISDGQVTVVSAEPPRAAWGPGRDIRRDALVAQLSRLNP